MIRPVVMLVLIALFGSGCRQGLDLVHCRDHRVGKKRFKDPDLVCDTTRTSGMIAFGRGFKEDSVNVFFGDSLLYAHTISTRRTGQAGSLSYHFPRSSSGSLRIVINGKCRHLIMKPERCYIWVDRTFGFLRIRGSNEFPGLFQ